MNKMPSIAPATLGRKSGLAVALGATMLAGGIALLVPGCTATKVPEQPAVALTVTVAGAHQVRWPTRVEANGAVAPWQEAVIGAQVSGQRLADIRVNVGDNVKRGQLLARFDAALLRADESRLKASWQQADANRLRALQLKGSGGISEQDVLQYVTDANVAKAQLQSTQLQLSYAEVIAPDDGVISARSATLGAVSSSGQELFRMIRQSRLEWRGELTAAQLAQVQSGQGIELTLPDGQPATAKVRQLAPSLDSQTRLGIAYADIAPGSTARAGMYAKGSVVLADSPAIVVPAASVVVRDGRSYVPRLLAGNRIGLQAVTVGRRQTGQVEIVSGLRDGDQVVAQGAGFLNEGDLVHVAAAPKIARE